MQRVWHPDDLVHYWTLSRDEHALLANKTGATRLGFALLLKAFQRDGRFPARRPDVPDSVIAHLATQVGVRAEVYREVDWSDRTQRHQRAQIRDYCGFRAFRAEDEAEFVRWLSTRVTVPNPEAEALKLAAYGYLRAQHTEPPLPERMRRVLRTAVRQREERLVAETAAHLSLATRAALDALIQTDGADEDEGAADQAVLFPVRSELATLKEDAGAVKVETVLEELEKLHLLRSVGLPGDLFHTVPVKLVTHYRQRAASEKPRALRRHPPDVRATLLAALCWQRQHEITDTLVDLLIHIAHRIGVRAEEKVDVALLKYAKKVVGKTKLLYKLAKAAKGQPDGTVKAVIFPAVGEDTLDAVIREAEADAGHERQVKLVTRASYSHHYRRIVPALLDVLVFRCNNDIHRPVMDALALLQRYRGRKTSMFPLHEAVPLDGVVRDDWQTLVTDEQGGRVNRISYEICVLTTLREKLRCKEVWVAGAYRFRNPDEDVPQDFDARRDEYYEELDQPRDAHTFVTHLRQAMEQALIDFDANLPTNTKVKIKTSKLGKGRISLTPLDEQPAPPNLGKLTVALVQYWPMTNLLDILKETELRVAFTEPLRTVGSREVLTPDILQRRLLLCLHGLGTNAGLKRMCSGGGEDRYADLQYVRRRYITRDQLRAAIAKVCNAIFAVRQADLWGEGTTACASDSKKFGAWDQNLMTEWHARYGGPGVMIYYHVERNSVCIYSQLKACSSSEVAAMIEGVLRHDTEMDVEKNYVDTHGQSVMWTHPNAARVGYAFRTPLAQPGGAACVFDATNPNRQPSRPLNWSTTTSNRSRLSPPSYANSSPAAIRPTPSLPTPTICSTLRAFSSCVA